MKKRVKLKMEKEVKVKSSKKNNTRASPTEEQANLTKPERKSMELDFRHFFATSLLDLANQEAAQAKSEEDQSFPEEHACKRGKRLCFLVADEQAESRNQMIQKRALKEAKLNRGLQLYKSYKKRVKESGLGVCKKRKRLVGNSLSESLKPLSFGDLLVLANAAEECKPFGVAESTCKQPESGEMNRGGSCYKKRVRKSGLGVCKKRFVGNSLSETLKPLSFGDLLVLANAAEECVPFGVKENTRKQRESEDMDRGGSCFGLSEKLQRNRELVQQGGKAALLKVVEQVQDNRDPRNGCRDDKLFEKKYIRKKRVKNKEKLESISVAGTCNGVKKLYKLRPSRLINVDDAQKEHGNGKTRSKSEQVEAVEARGCCSGIRNKRKRKSKTQCRDENPAITQKSSIISHILRIKNQEICKRKRSKRKRKYKEPERYLGASVGERRKEKERAFDQIDSDAGDLETDTDADEPEEEEEKERACDQIDNAAGGLETYTDAGKPEVEEENSISEGGSETEPEADNDVLKPEENTISEGDSKTEVDTADNTEILVGQEEDNTISKLEASQSTLGPHISDEEVIVSEQEGSLPLTEVAETEEEEEVFESSSCNWSSFRKPLSGYGMRNVQWSIKKKRTRMTLHETQSNRKILLLALETITPQFGLLNISTKKKKMN